MFYIVLTLLLILLPLLWQILHKNLSTKLPPGPFPLPIVGNLHLLGPLPHRSLAKLAQLYGPIMYLKLGLVQTIVVSSPQAAQLFFKHDIIFASRPATQVAAHMFYGAKDMGFAPYGDYWRRVRKLCTLHLLTSSKVEGFESLRSNEIQKTVRRLKEVADEGGAFGVGKMVGELIEEIMFKMVVGKGKDEDKRYDLKAVVGQTLELAGAFNFADFLPFLAPFDIQGLTRKMKRLSKVVDEILEDIIEDHLKEENVGQQRDILSSMLTLMNKPNNEFSSSTSFGKDNIKAVMLDLFSAGIDTTSHSITWAISALVNNPRVMTLLQHELDEVVGKSRMVQESDLPKLPYLDIVVKETLRLYPVGPLLIPRESMQDILINGCKIPKKSRVIINFWAIARDPKVWSDTAEVFYPERFIGNKVDVQGNNYEFFPFGSGRRKCPGIQLGMVTLKIVLASIVHCFDLGLSHGMKNEEVDMTERFGLAMGRAHELFVIPSYRLQV